MNFQQRPLAVVQETNEYEDVDLWGEKPTATLLRFTNPLNKFR